MPTNLNADSYKIKKFLFENADTIADVYTIASFFIELLNPPSLHNVPAKKLKKDRKSATLKSLFFLPLAIGMRAVVFPYLKIKQTHSWIDSFRIFLLMLACSIPEGKVLNSLQEIWFIWREQTKRKKQLKKRDKGLVFRPGLFSSVSP